MKTVSASEESTGKAVEILKKGGVVIAPTDSVYGLLGDALSEQAVNRIRDIKGRDSQKPFQIAILKKDADKYGILNANAKKVIKKFWPGDVNIIVEKTDRVPDFISKDTVCLTCHRNEIMHAIMQAVKRPLVSTSVNLSGMPPAIKVEDVDKEIARKVDLILDGRETKNKKPNTIVDLTKSRLEIVREGPVS
ncbi:MAG: threonylcarbamoyl-AMP synthase, partial [Candidatus Altiarchaeales archaeon]|nr:threonylcarbamoyl-AMP synthase [Candidatus Altiarchaeales archaeon]